MQSYVSVLNAYAKAGIDKVLTLMFAYFPDVPEPLEQKAVKTQPVPPEQAGGYGVAIFPIGPTLFGAMEQVFRQIDTGGNSNGVLDAGDFQGSPVLWVRSLL